MDQRQLSATDFGLFGAGRVYSQPPLRGAPSVSQPPPRRPTDDDDVDDRYADERINQRSRPMVGYFTLIVSVAYVVLGVVVLLVPPGKLALPRVLQYVFGLLLIGYGTWRVNRARQKYFR